MYVRITQGRTKVGTWNEFEAVYRRNIEGNPAPGLRARWLVRSTSEADTFFTVSIWNSLAEMEAHERSDAVHRQILPFIAPYLDGASAAHHCEVRGNPPLKLDDLVGLLAGTLRHAS